MEKKSRKEYLLNLTPLLISLIYLILGIIVIKCRGILVWDEAARSVGGVVLLKFISSSLPLNEFLNRLLETHPYSYQGTLLFGPFQAVTNAFFYAFLGFSPASAAIPNIVFGSASIFLCYKIASIAYNRDIGILSAIFLFGSQSFFNLSLVNWTHVNVTFCILMGTILIFVIKKKYIASGNMRINNFFGRSDLHCFILSIFSGLFFSFAMLTRPSAILILFPVIIYVFISLYQTSKIKKRFTMVMPVLIPIIIVLSYWSYLNSLDFLFQEYIPFWTGEIGHPGTKPFSTEVILNLFKPILIMFPILVSLFAFLSILHILRRKPSQEELFLILWIIVFHFSIILSGAMSVEYTVPTAPPIAILASYGIINILYKTKNRENEFSRNSEMAYGKKDGGWKESIVLILVLIAVFQSIIAPFYGTISFYEDDFPYNPFFIRTIIKNAAPSLLYIDTVSYRGEADTTHFVSISHPGEVDLQHSMVNAILSDIKRYEYKKATVIFIEEKDNYFDIWYLIGDEELAYKFISIPYVANLNKMLAANLIYNPGQKYIVIPKKIQFQNDYHRLDGEYSLYKVSLFNNTFLLELMEIKYEYKYCDYLST